MDRHDYHRFMNGSMHEGGDGWLFLVLLVLVLAALTALVVVALRRRSDVPATVTGTTDGPRQLLARRYAGGEIDDEEYVHRLKVLGTT